jgi:hypothetical protein
MLWTSQMAIESALSGKGGFELRGVVKPLAFFWRRRKTTTTTWSMRRSSGTRVTHEELALLPKKLARLFRRY